MNELLLVMTNVPDMATATSMARHLVEHKLAACVNCVAGVKSTYMWEGGIEEVSEVSLWIKTTHTRYAELQAVITSLHPYQVPEIIAMPITAGWPPYLDWIVKETKKDVHV